MRGVGGGPEVQLEEAASLRGSSGGGNQDRREEDFVQSISKSGNIVPSVSRDVNECWAHESVAEAIELTVYVSGAGVRDAGA